MLLCTPKPGTDAAEKILAAALYNGTFITISVKKNKADAIWVVARDYKTKEFILAISYSYPQIQTILQSLDVAKGLVTHYIAEFAIMERDKLAEKKGVRYAH